MIGRTISYNNADLFVRISLCIPESGTTTFGVLRVSLVTVIVFINNSNLLEWVQHKFTRMVPKLKQLSYEQRLEYLGLWTLEEKRNRADLLEVYKGFSATRLNDLFVPQTAIRTAG